MIEMAIEPWAIVFTLSALVACGSGVEVGFACSHNERWGVPVTMAVCGVAMAGLAVTQGQVQKGDAMSAESNPTVVQIVSLVDIDDGGHVELVDLDLPRGAVIHGAVSHPDTEVPAIVVQMDPTARTVKRRIRMVHGGVEIPGGTVVEYLGTVETPCRCPLVHVFEQSRPLVQASEAGEAAE